MEIITVKRRPRCGRRKIRHHSHGLHFNFIAQSMAPYNHGGLFQSLNNGTPDASQYQNNPRLPGFGFNCKFYYDNPVTIKVEQITDVHSLKYSLHLLWRGNH